MDLNVYEFPKAAFFLSKSNLVDTSLVASGQIRFIQRGGLNNRPFYSFLLSDLAFEWQRGWR